MFETFRNALAAAVIDPPESLVLKVARSITPKDAPIVAAALQAQAQYLATYDRKHLLSQKELIKSHFGITVALPDEVIGQMG